MNIYSITISRVTTNTRVRYALAAATLLAGAACAATPDDGLPPDPPGDPAKTPLPKGKPWVPGWCRWDWRAGWLGMHRANVARTKKGGIDVIFYGESLTQGFGDLKPVKKRNPGVRMVNYGIGGDSTRQLLYRIRHGEVDGISPKLIVLNIGTNNLYGDANGGTDGEIARGIRAVVELLRRKLPKTKILLMGMLPRQNAHFCGRIDRINVMTAKLDDGKMVRYLCIGDAFEHSHGRVRQELYSKDQLHLVPAGYEVWAGQMDPLFKELLRGG